MINQVFALVWVFLYTAGADPTGRKQYLNDGETWCQRDFLYQDIWQPNLN